MELDLANAGIHMLVEKPISMRPAEEVNRLAQVHTQLLYYLAPYLAIDRWSRS